MSGLRWLALRSVVGELMGIGFAVALARLVTPAQFGHAAVALVFGLLAVILTFEGLGSAVVQRPTISARHLEVSVLMNLIAGVALTLLTILIAPVVLNPIFGGDTTSLIVLISPSFAISALGTVSRARLWRELEFGRVTRIDLAAALVGNVVGVTLAAAGLGGKAIVIGSLASVAGTSVLMVIAAPEPLPRWHKQEARDIIGYGVNSALAGLTDLLFANVDYWILAARLSAFTTGIYYRAFNCGVVYQSKISRVMQQVSFPVYARLESRAEIRRLHERSARVHAVVIFPLLTLLAVLAPVAIPFVFGSAWRASVGPTEILALAGMCAAVLTGAPQVMQAVGQPGALVKFRLATLVIYAAAILLTASHGLTAVAIAVVTVYVLSVAGAYHFLLGPAIGVSLRRLVPELAPALTGCAVMAIACDPLRRVVSPAFPQVATITVVGVAGLALYALVLRVGFRSAWHDLMLLTVQVLPRISRHRNPKVPGTEVMPVQLESGAGGAPISEQLSGVVGGAD